MATDRFQYGYDRDSNVTSRDNLVNGAFGELYGYDNLGQITGFQRGTLNGSKTGLASAASRSQAWNYDATGNWSGVTSDGVTQTRTANARNEVTSVGGASTPVYDAAGNLTGDEAGKRFVYDAWNRLVQVQDAAGNPVATYRYDGLGRRVSEAKAGVTRDLYYSAAWQVLEERVGGQAQAQYVWSPVYVDALVLRDRSTQGSGVLDERLWAQQDANWNVTALVNGSGNVVERYAYDPYGAVTVYDGNWNVQASGTAIGWQYLHQGLRYDAGTGLYDARNRAYSPSLGRWLQTDPLGFAAGDVNLYGFVGEGPTDRVDPSGLFDLNDTWLGRRAVNL